MNLAGWRVRQFQESDAHLVALRTRHMDQMRAGNWVGPLPQLAIPTALHNLQNDVRLALVGNEDITSMGL